MDISFFEHSPRFKTNQLLYNVQSLQALTPSLLTTLQTSLDEGKHTIDKFKVRPTEWQDWCTRWWAEGDSSGGSKHIRDAIEYDTDRQHIIIQGKPGPLQDAVETTLVGFFDELRDLVFGISRHQQSTAVPSTRQKKRPEEQDRDISLFAGLEIGVNEPIRALLKTAGQQLNPTISSSKRKNVVIVIDIHERRPPPIRSFKQFDLSAEEIKAQSVSDLGSAIIRWYQRNRNPLVSVFSLGVYLCYPDEVQMICQAEIAPSQDDTKVQMSMGIGIPYARLVPELQTKRENLFQVPVEELVRELQKTVSWVLPHYRAQRKALELKKRVAKRSVSQR